LSAGLFIARRYIRSHRRKGFLSFISGFAILGITLGTAALIITLSVLDGFEREIKNKVIEFSSHIQITGFQNLSLHNPRATIDRLRREVPGIKSIEPFAAKEGMIRFHSAVDGIFLMGVDPASGTLASTTHLVEGLPLSDSAGANREIVIGKKLAVRLNAGVGDKVVLFSLPENQGGTPRAMQCAIRGIYESGMAEFDDVYAYLRLADVQEFLRLGGDVSGYDIFVDDLARIDEVATGIQAHLEYPHYARTVFQRYRNLFSWVELQKKLSPILLSLIIVVAMVNIVGTLLMFVLEKTRAIGILKSLGAGPPLIRRIFVLQGMAIGLVGVILGNILAYALCALQLHYRILTLPSDIYYMDTVPIILQPLNFFLVTVVALVLCFLTTLLPSRAASALDPVAALRFG
jgi:lipoprotein-releasing system permease protein